MKAKKQSIFLPFYLFTFLPLNIMPNDKKAYAQRKGVYAGKTLPTDQGWNDQGKPHSYCCEG